MNENKPDYLNAAASFVIVLLVSILSYYLVSLINPGGSVSIPRSDLNAIRTDVEEVKETLAHGPPPKPSEYPDFDLINATNTTFKKILIVENAESFVLSGDIVGRIKKTLHPVGSFQRMYIYVEASVDQGKPLSVYDDLYMTFNGEGGHVRPADSLTTPPNTLSSLLYPAKALPYGELGKKPTYVADILAVFNAAKTLGVDMFLSSARRGGLISEVAIYYECAIGSDCSVSQ